MIKLEATQSDMLALNKYVIKFGFAQLTRMSNNRQIEGKKFSHIFVQ